MKVKVNNITAKTIKNWESFLKNHPHKTVFQSFEMYGFYEKVRNFKPFLFLCENGKSNCVGVLLAVKIKEGNFLKGFLSSRIIIYGGPVIILDEKKRLKILNLLLDSMVNKLKNRSIFIQFRNFFRWTDKEKEVFYKYGFSFNDRLNLIVNTVSYDKVLSNIKSTKKRQLRKAQNEGVVIERASDIDEVGVLYELLFNLYKTKVKKPLPNWSFFKEFYQHGLNSNFGVILLVKLNDKIIGGILCPITDNKTIYEWYVVGDDKKFKKYYPSVMATWAPINYALNHNIKTFDFMGLGKPDVNYGVRDFKLNFGNNIVNFGRFGRCNKYLYPMVDFIYNILKYLQ